LTRRGAELSAGRSRPLSRARGDGPTAKGCVLDCHEPRQDGRVPGQKLLNVELPAKGTRVWGASIRERTDRPLKHARGRGGLLKGGLDIRYHVRHGGSPAGERLRRRRERAWRQALGGSEGLSFMR